MSGLQIRPNENHEHMLVLSLSNAYVNLTYVKVYGRGFRSAMFGVLTLVSERTFSIPAQALLDKLDFNISRTSFQCRFSVISDLRGLNITNCCILVA